MTPWRKLAAESIGTAFLLAMVVGSGIMGERLAGGNEAITPDLERVVATIGLLGTVLLCRASALNLRPMRWPPKSPPPTGLLLRPHSRIQQSRWAAQSQTLLRASRQCMLSVLLLLSCGTGTNQAHAGDRGRTLVMHGVSVRAAQILGAMKRTRQIGRGVFWTLQAPLAHNALCRKATSRYLQPLPLCCIGRLHHARTRR